MAGTPNAPLCHTYSSREVKSYHLNDEEVGEFGCRVLLAASVGVPTIFLSGDDQAVAEARAFLPGIVTVTTKTGLGIEWALHRSPQESRRRIRQSVRQACHKPLPKTLPHRDPPYALKVTLLEGVNPKPWIARGGKLIRRGVLEFRSNSLLDLPI